MRKISLLAIVCSSLVAQSNLASLSGSVQDAHKNAIARAEITLKSADTSAVRTAALNAEGLFEIAGLAPGEYLLEVRASGFAPLERKLRLEVGQHVRLDLPMEIGQASEQVDVVGRAEVLKTADASLGEVIEPVAVRELPLNGRMLLDLALTVPGSHISHGAQSGDTSPLYWRPGQRSALSIGGNRPNANYFLLDGTTNTDPTFNTLNLSPSPDAVQEFKVQTGSYSAELGGAGGGQIRGNFTEPLTNFCVTMRSTRAHLMKRRERRT
jgi:carboxypeptidase family protein